eukprot:scaffold144623_cov33-Tisochrysis_lutea.AAC.1
MPAKGIDSARTDANSGDECNTIKCQPLRDMSSCKCMGKRSPERSHTLLRRDSREAVEDASVARHLARDDLRVSILSLDEELHPLDRRSGGLGDRARNTTCTEVNEELHRSRLLCRRSCEVAAGRVGVQRMELAAMRNRVGGGAVTSAVNRMWAGANAAAAVATAPSRPRRLGAAGA